MTAEDTKRMAEVRVKLNQAITDLNYYSLKVAQSNSKITTLRDELAQLERVAGGQP